MYRKVLTAVIIIVSLAEPSCQKVTGFEYYLDEGTVIEGVKVGWHDLYLVNNSGRDLHEVNVIITLVGEDGSPRPEKKYYAVWSAGQTVKASLSRENSPINVQKVSLEGSCDEGAIDSSWVHSKRSR